jgi:23S rRNA (uracil-5-)-methyltransferase RumA
VAHSKAEADEPTVRTETLTLGRFDSHGTTRARLGSRWIEVEHGIPGEVVLAEIRGKRRLTGHIVEVDEPSSDRITAPCVYFRDWACGGCQWQHIGYEAQLRRKREIVEEVMRDGGLEIPVGSVHALDDPWRYRSSAAISLGKRAGFRRRASLAIVPIRDCLISDPLIGNLMASLNDHLDRGSLPDFRGRVRVEVRVQGEPGRSSLLAQIQLDPEFPAQPADIDKLAEALDNIPFVSGLSIRQLDGSTRQLSGTQIGHVMLRGLSLALSAASFFQSNLRLLPRLIDRLEQEGAPLAGKHVLDVYAGMGLFGLFLAAEAESVTAIESSAEAVLVGRQTAEEWGLANFTFVGSSAEDALEDARKADVVILNPPRSGLSARALDLVASLRPDTILYVSCLAESLARDLARFATHAYACRRLELFDFYPQTYHVELLAVVSRE